eukprot:m.57253 g.57253  ORF g.57253 m.57253 type:complete len:424 (+) comp13445_c0_seq3:105-1376(+)
MHALVSPSSAAMCVGGERGLAVRGDHDAAKSGGTTMMISHWWWERRASRIIAKVTQTHAQPSGALTFRHCQPEAFRITAQLFASITAMAATTVAHKRSLVELEAEDNAPLIESLARVPRAESVEKAPAADEELHKPMVSSISKRDTEKAVIATNFAPDKKPKELFRAHLDASNPRFEIVRKTYELMHVGQTVESVRARIAKWTQFNTKKMTMMDALFELNKLVDDSDPDVDVPNSGHAFQTAERIRQLHPDKDWFHLTGLIHDVGKVLALWGEPQWATVGDTYPVGCKPGKSVVFREQFELCPDQKNPEYNTDFGIYEPNCGLDSLLMTWGHDEYMYRVLKHNNSTLPMEGLYMIRYHSFYPWHTGNDYLHLTSKRDEEMRAWVEEFNKFDLYSKCDDVPDVEALKPYYQSLIDKYCPGLLSW